MKNLNFNKIFNRKEIKLNINFSMYQNKKKFLSQDRQVQ